MKKLFLLFLIYNFNLLGQIEIINNSLTNPQEKILYCTTNNLKVKGIEMDSSYILTFGLDTLRHCENLIYSRPNSTKKYDTIILSKNDSILHREIFQLKLLPRLSIYFGMVRNTFVTRSYLLSNPGLILTYDSSSYIPCSQIEWFSVIIIKRNGKEKDITDIGEISTENWSDKKVTRYEQRMIKNYDKPHTIFYARNTFGTAQLRHIKRMKKGEILWFKKARISCSSCISRLETTNIKLTLID